jgi:hypothetical protein
MEGESSESCIPVSGLAIESIMAWIALSSTEIGYQWSEAFSSGSPLSKYIDKVPVRVLPYTMAGLPSAYIANVCNMT